VLSVGIVGLPNVGKSTLFNALTAGGAEVSNYPFTTIDPNLGMVAVPDTRLGELARVIHPEKVTPCTVRFIDIAGLMRGASEGEGLGNQFLGEIRAVDAVAEVVRGFPDASVVHVLGEVDPVRDAAIVETELLLADLELLERVMSRREKDWATHPREHSDERRRLLHYRDLLASGERLLALDLAPIERVQLKALGLLTGKPLLYVLNVAEEPPTDADSAWLERLLARSSGAHAVAVAAKLDWELDQLEPGERAEMMEGMGIAEPCRNRLIRAAFELLGLVSFFTIAKNKLQAWEVPAGTHAPAAAGQVHTDMERGFIRAHVARWDQLVEHGGWHHLQRTGLLHTVGKDYQVRDGDVVEFLFNV
jgi:ribosome-binding ATPase